MRYGEPIITTRITEITPDGPRYRGRLAIDLAAKGYTFKAVALGLWTNERKPGRCDPGDLCLAKSAPASDRPQHLRRVLGASMG